MGIGDVFKNILGKEKKEFKPPAVKFLDSDDPTGVTHTMPISIRPPSQKYVIKHKDEYIVFNSLDEMPAELREEIKHLDDVPEFTHSYSVIIDGQRQTFSSIEEIPEEIREAIKDKS
ncbi:MAG: hypothetical protein JW808_03080 [Victivallales bacterium]|nr:hypothetical protein [Victivallales bacterium]